MIFSYYKRVFIAILTLTFLFGCSFIKYRSENQMELHKKLSQKKMKVAVLPFTLNTPKDVKNVAFDNVDVELTNSFIKTIWKKNKVRIAKKADVLEAMKKVHIKRGELNPDMEDLAEKPNLQKIIEIGKALNANVVFTGTVRTNKYDYEGGCCVFIPSLMASKRVYNIGAQMMAVDVDKGTALAFDYINNRLAVPTKFFSITGGVSDEALAKGKAKLLEKCGFALAYYAPMPEKRTDAGTIALVTGAALLNAFAGTEFSVDASIKDETWKMYPPGYFEKNYGYTMADVNSIPN